MKSPEVAEQFMAQGAEPLGSTPEEYAGGVCHPGHTSGLRALFEDRPETVQLRLFRSGLGGLFYVGMVELRRPVDVAALDVARFSTAAKYLDLINVYLPYFRKGSTPPALMANGKVEA